MTAPTTEQLKEMIAGCGDLADRGFTSMPFGPATIRAMAKEIIASREAVKLTPQRMFPIMGGPDIPWALIEPYQHQARKNHYQTLDKLAARGGLSICEAMAIMSEADFRNRPIAKPTVEDWLDFVAERATRAAIRARQESGHEHHK